MNASHSRSISEGWVTGTCRAISLGNTLCTHEVAITDHEGERLSTVRIPDYLKRIR